MKMKTIYNVEEGSLDLRMDIDGGMISFVDDTGAISIEINLTEDDMHYLRDRFTKRV